jgi:hypothetical protein
VVPSRLNEMAGELLVPGWVCTLGARLDHFAAALGWSLAVAAAVVLLWTLFRLVRPRS